MNSQYDEWHTCYHCQRVLIDKPLLDTNPDGDPWEVRTTLPHTWKEGYRAAREGCPLFATWLHEAEKDEDSPHHWSKPFTLLLYGIGGEQIGGAQIYTRSDHMDMFVSCFGGRCPR